ncbi:hypothetical protein [Rhizobium sp. 12,4]|uniref:hypothetical protein n=1 Tax=Rhizobium sp. 12,4 TaxID=3405135 RepID=UPI003D35554B
MSATSMSIADRPPADPDQASAFHAGLLDTINAAARDWHGWTGSTIADFGKSGGITFLQLNPGEAFATLEDLRAFREEQRRRQETAENDNQAEQGRLL